MHAAKCFVAVSAVVAIALSVSAAHAQSIPNVLKKLEESRDSSCRASKSSIADLVYRIEQTAISGGNVGEIANALSVLAREDFWESSDQSESLRSLTNAGSKYPALGPRFAEVQSAARGELKSIVFRNLDDPERMIDELDALASINLNIDKGNPHYVAEINLTLAEYLADHAFRLISEWAWSVPLNTTLELEGKELEAYQLTHKLLREAVNRYQKLAEFYSVEFSEGSIFTRDLGPDFRYQKILLQYLLNDKIWAAELNDLAATASSSNLYASFDSVPHIFVYGFLLPPRAVQVESRTNANTDGNSSCLPSQGGSIGVNNVNVGPVVKRFYNPVQLAAYTCTVLNEQASYPSLLALSSKLSRFSNYDYRIVLGHFEGDRVRFSRLTRGELIEGAREVLGGLSDFETSIGVVSPIQECVPEGAEELVAPAALVLSEQETGPDEGYIYLGSQMTYTQAKRLLDLLTNSKIFRDAYLIRPRI
ncbi:hypothetical protein K3555_22845 (plasmid) [Leisingera sp. M527]|uniref:hypothetical protein n=1 Tax=Leisingera sp. M527 TaxID=2867014 RepID=UPI0021A8D5B8|nr:hypothetical protein [Leisingera sp. M527]UWQ35366.1 hypothetical protein K3555_22845 [Leisingera sp. M527]